MARPRTAAGELGSVQITVLADGRVRARARMRDDAGQIQQLRAVAATESDARAALTRRAALAATGAGGAVTAESTLAEAAAAWLAQVHARATSGAITHSTYESYESSVRLILHPRRRRGHHGASPSDGAIGSSRGSSSADPSPPPAEHAPCSARSAATPSATTRWAATRSATCNACPAPRRRPPVLTPAQITAIRALMLAWRAEDELRPPPERPSPDRRDGHHARHLRPRRGMPRPAPPRRRHHRRAADAADQRDHHPDQAEGIRRKDSPKRSRQRRRIALPSMAAAAVRHRLALAPSGENALLFPTSTGRPMSVSNYERLLRSFVADNRHPLEELGVDPELYTTHIYRRTTATLIEAAAGITLASRLLGHANEQITRASYVVTAEQVDPSTARLLDDILNG